MEFLLVLVILLAVVFIVTGPLRRPESVDRRAGPDRRDGVDGNGRGSGAGPGHTPNSEAAAFDRESELDELEAARAAKYREIRDTQLDYDTGKLSREDFDALDSGLRAQALEILQRIDRLQPPAPTAGAGPETPGTREPGPREPE